MSQNHSQVEILEREFLELRSRILDLASGLDRIELGSGDASGDVRMRQIADAIGIIVSVRADRAERVQMVFSDRYDTEWRACNDAI